MNQSKLISCECYPDEELFKILFAEEFIYFKGNGKPDVLNLIEKKHEKYSLIIGVIDEDPYQPKPNKLILNYSEIKQLELFKIYKHKLFNAIIIEQKNDLEYVLISLAKKASIPLGKYKLKDNPKALHSQIAHRKNKIPKAYFDFIAELIILSEDLISLKDFVDNC